MDINFKLTVREIVLIAIITWQRGLPFMGDYSRKYFIVDLTLKAARHAANLAPPTPVWALACCPAGLAHLFNRTLRGPPSSAVAFRTAMGREARRIKYKRQRGQHSAGYRGILGR
jgi:hypothetical protein